MKTVVHPKAVGLRTTRAAVHSLLAAGLTLWSAICVAQSDSPPTERLRFSGFGTLGLLHTDAPDGWSFRRDISQVGSSRNTRADVDSRLGLQLNYQAIQQIELVGQLIVARTSPYAQLSDSVQRAFAAYRPSPDWALRVGRVNVDQYIMSDYRSVGFAYLTVRPPVDVYGFATTTLDGADLTRSWNFGETQWRVKGYVGQAHTGDLSRSGSRLLVNALSGLVVSREADGLLLRASVSRAKIDHSTESGQMVDRALEALTALPAATVVDEVGTLRQRLDITREPVTYVTAGVNDDWNEWQFTAEAIRAYGPPIARYEAAYVRVARRFGPVAAFGGFSRVRPTYSRVRTPDWTATLAPLVGDAVAQQAQYLGAVAANGINSSGADQHTLSAGARWDLHPQLALKFQWDVVDTAADGGALWAHATTAGAHSNVISVALDFVF